MSPFIYSVCRPTMFFLLVCTQPLPQLNISLDNLHFTVIIIIIIVLHNNITIN